MPCLKSFELLIAGIVLGLLVTTWDVDGCCLPLMITSFARTGPRDSALTGMRHKGHCDSILYLQ